MLPTKLAAGRVLVTGAGGFIGATLCRQLLAAGCRDLGGLDLGEAPADLAGRLAWFRADITAPESCRRAFSAVSCVFHLAALASDWASRRVFGRINYQGTANVVELCRRAGVEKPGTTADIPAIRMDNTGTGARSCPWCNRGDRGKAGGC